MPPRRPESASIDALVRDALGDVVRQASAEIVQAIAQLTAAELTAQLESGIAEAPGARVKAPRRAARQELSRWAADRRARRVPTFVIELTGLKTKKQIVARYGDGAVFERGRPLPKAKA